MKPRGGQIIDKLRYKGNRVDLYECWRRTSTVTHSLARGKTEEVVWYHSFLLLSEEVGPHDADKRVDLAWHTHESQSCMERRPVRFVDAEVYSGGSFWKGTLFNRLTAVTVAWSDGKHQRVPFYLG